MLGAFSISSSISILLAFILFFGGAVRAEELVEKQSEPQIRINPTVEKALRRLSFAAKTTPEKDVKPAEPKPTPEELAADDIALTTLRDQYLKTLFVNKKGVWFTQYRRGLIQIPYQLSGFQLIGPDESMLSESDRSEGIDRRLDYSFLIQSYRTYSKTGGWGPWIPGNPPELMGMTVVRRDGKWEIRNEGEIHFSVK